MQAYGAALVQGLHKRQALPHVLIVQTEEIKVQQDTINDGWIFPCYTCIYFEHLLKLMPINYEMMCASVVSDNNV